MSGLSNLQIANLHQYQHIVYYLLVKRTRSVLLLLYFLLEMLLCFDLGKVFYTGFKAGHLSIAMVIAISQFS